ncbi:hypothetical protein BT93_L5002 [Corymbia citriodora subsp. variegata]|uniref:PGG domain-containing protein n=1 Tax=Corymbia citriodora subsp. variegata TaxID=360336 RepID=A0A8T0CT25_CORYI|nr:hypothetical protein BT93_L5002 [Corymbia citriodora subsp. variegata]
MNNLCQWIRSQIMRHDYSIRKFFTTLIKHEEVVVENNLQDKLRKEEYRNYHLVVATLIAAVTFQAGVNPPGGVWQENLRGCITPNHEAGRAIYASDPTAFYVFLAFNTLAFSSSMLLIICHTWTFPFFLEVVVAMISMGITYGASIFAITPKHMKTQSLLSIAAVPAIVRGVILIWNCANPKPEQKPEESVPEPKIRNRTEL